MALIFTDPNPAGPFATFQDKDVHCRVYKLTNTNFGTVAVNTLLGVLPADSSIVNITYWNKTQLAGGSVSAATLSLGSSSGGTQFASAYNVFTASGTKADLSPVTNIFQPYNVPLGQDIQIWASGAATTGNPTSGEIYLMVEFVR